MAGQKRVFRSEADVEAILARQEASGLSVSAFSKQEGVPASTVHNWKKVRSMGEPSSAGVPRLRRVQLAANTNEATMLELVFPGGVRLRVPADLARERLEEVLQAALACSA